MVWKKRLDVIYRVGEPLLIKPKDKIINRLF
jgi:hypothetical protein